MKKYKLTATKKEIDGCLILLQIEALESFNNIKKGELGGFVEKEENLSQNGNAWISKNAQFFRDAKVFGDVWISEDTKISKTNEYLIYGPIGSRSAFITIIKDQNYISTGCWSGTKEEFIKRVKETHGNNQYAKDYLALIKFVFKKEK